jgi:3-hydroxyacyl-CoA dehydrogenase/enoyl-CoA hydratase/3-hydroxybutyryl-CoA epimerase
MPYIVEACLMVEEGVPVSQIDRLAKKFGMPMGPVQLMGEVGIPVIVKVFHILMQHFSDHMPSPTWIEREDLESAFPRGADKKIHPDGAKISSWTGKSDPGYPDEDVLDRLVHALVNEAARCMSEGIVDDARLLDLAMVMGTGFPPFRGGLLREADVRGLPNVVARSKVLSERYGKHLAAPQGLVDQAENPGRYRQD